MQVGKQESMRSVAPEQHRLARSQAKVLLLVLLSEVILLYVDHPGEGHLVSLILAREREYLQPSMQPMMLGIHRTLSAQAWCMCMCMYCKCMCLLD